jgi:hypothetical protein
MRARFTLVRPASITTMPFGRQGSSEWRADEESRHEGLRIITSAKSHCRSIALGCGDAVRNGHRRAGCITVASGRSATTTVTVTGSGFSACALVDIYFDTTDLCLAIAGGTGNIRCVIAIPKETQPQTHWISAVQRSTSTGAQKSFIVSATKRYPLSISRRYQWLIHKF